MGQSDFRFFSDHIESAAFHQGGKQAIVEIEYPPEPVEVDARRRAVLQCLESLGGIPAFERSQLGKAHLRTPTLAMRGGIDHNPAAQGTQGRLVANDEAIATQCAHGLVGDELHERRFARLDRSASANRDPCGHVASPEVQVHRRPVRKRPRFGFKYSQTHFHSLCRRMQRGIHHPVATHYLPNLDPGQVQGAALAGVCLGGSFPIFLDAAHTHFDPGG